MLAGSYESTASTQPGGLEPPPIVGGGDGVSVGATVGSADPGATAEVGTCDRAAEGDAPDGGAELAPQAATNATAAREVDASRVNDVINTMTRRPADWFILCT